MWDLIWLIIATGLVRADSEKDFINFGDFVCPRDENALGLCLRDNLNAYIPKMANGVAEYGIPPLEPLVVPLMTIHKTAGPLSINSSYTDVYIRGGSATKILDVQVNKSARQVKANLFIPELKWKGNYKMNGRCLMIPFEKEGYFTAKFGDIDVMVTLAVDRLPQYEASDVLKCNNIDLKFNAGYASLQLENLSGQDDEFSQMVNKFLEDNWREITEEVEKSLRVVLKPLVNMALNTLSADDILS